MSINKNIFDVFRLDSSCLELEIDEEVPIRANCVTVEKSRLQRVCPISVVLRARKECSTDELSTINSYTTF